MENISDFIEMREIKQQEIFEAIYQELDILNKRIKKLEDKNNG